MEDSLQERLFANTPGTVSPPEPGLYLGTSGWSYADWEGTLYPRGLPPGSRLAEYAKKYSTVEIDSTFYGIPRRQTVERWRDIVPEGFLFAAKFPRDITHERALGGSESLAKEFIGTMRLLGDRLGPLLVQLPPSFEAREIDNLKSFLSTLPEGVRYAVEVRHRSWVNSDLMDLLRERGIALALVDRPGMPRLQEATADFVYARLLGNRREFPSDHTHPKRDRAEDLAWWSELASGFLSEGREVFLYANNHYQNHSPSTLEQFLEIRRGGGE